jgi:hypothetical protein
MTRLERAGLLVIGVAILAAIGAALYLAVVPAYEGYMTGADTGGIRTGPVTLPMKTLADVNGAGVYLVLLFPVVLAALPLVAREPLARSWGTWFAAIILTAFCMISAWTVGRFYSPAALLLVCAATLLTLGGRQRKVGRAIDMM